MGEGESNDERAAYEDTVALPAAERGQLSSTATFTTVEPWEEATQMDQPWGADSSEALPLSRLALPPTFGEDDEDDNELTDYALVIEPDTPPVRVDAGSAPTLLPRRPLPEPLSFRPNTGTTPPPRRAPADSPSISWRTPASADQEEETAPTVELELRRQPRPAEKRSVTLQGPAPMPSRAPTQTPLPLPSYPTLDYREAPIAANSARPPRLTVLAFTIAGILFGTLVGVLAALFFSERPEISPPVAMTRDVVATAVVVPAEPSVQEELQQAEPAAQLANDEQASAASPHVAAGMAQLEAHQLDAAAQSFRNELRADPGSSKATLGMGLLSEERGNIHQALYWYRRYLKNAGEGEGASAVRDRIDALRAR